jgi:hypothetical protein
MRKFLLALVIGATASTSAFAGTASDDVFASKNSYDIGAMYSANRTEGQEGDRQVALVASLAPVAIPAVVFSSLNSHDIPAMFGAAHKAPAATLTTTEAAPLSLFADPIPGGP